MQTNTSVIVYRKSVGWEGQKTSTVVGTYDAWIEQSEVTKFMPNKSGEVIVGKGILFLFDEIGNINNCQLEVDGNLLDIVGVDTFLDDDGTFHHYEITYR